MTQKQQVAKFIRKHFTTRGIKVGDIVVTFELHRVKARWSTLPGNQDYGKEWVVTDAALAGYGDRIMHEGRGQQGIAKLK